MIIPEGFRPDIITEGNILLNPPSGGSINDILYRKLMNPLLIKLRKNLLNNKCTSERTGELTGTRSWINAYLM